MRIVRFGLSLSVVLVPCCVSNCFSQSTYTLQPLAPARPANELQPLPPPVSTTEITLTRLQSSALPQQTPAEAPNKINIEPMQKSKDNPMSKSLTVDALIRNSQDPSAVFARLQVDREFLSSSGPDDGVRGSDLMAGEMGIAEWGGFAYCWESPSFCHSPLYFEQPNLERYGSRNPSLVTPFLSAGHFYGSMILLPAKVVQKPWWKCSCTLGHRRPGNCNPLQRHVSLENRSFLVTQHTGVEGHQGEGFPSQSIDPSQSTSPQLATSPMILPEEELGLEDVHVLTGAFMPVSVANPTNSQTLPVPSPAGNLAIPAMATTPAVPLPTSTVKPAPANAKPSNSSGPVVLRISSK